MKIQILGCAVLLSSALLAAWSEKASNTDSAQNKNQLIIKQTVDVPMRDGVTLRADIWSPSADGRFPVLVYRTPYGRKSAEKEYTTFEHAVERGYVVLIQDVRGRFDSGGEFRPYENEGHDGFDTIEWAARQSYIALGNLMTEIRDFQNVAQHPWLLAPALLLVAVMGALQAISQPVRSSYDCT